jgi:hypothetical protein
MKVLAAALCGLLLAALPSTTAMADTVYTYTGNPFTTAISGLFVALPAGSFTASDFVSGSFTVSSPLGADLVAQIISPSYSFTDGPDTFSSSNPNVSKFEIWTDANGDISNWDIVLADDQSFNPSLKTENPLGVAPFITEDLGFADNVEGINFANPGTWTQTTTDPTVPEPSSLVLLGTGVLSAAGALRRRFPS